MFLLYTENILLMNVLHYYKNLVTLNTLKILRLLKLLRWQFLSVTVLSMIEGKALPPPPRHPATSSTGAGHSSSVSVYSGLSLNSWLFSCILAP